MKILKITGLLLALALSPLLSALGDKNSESKLFIGSDSEPAKVVNLFHEALKQQNSNNARMHLADDVLIYEGAGVERSADEYASHHMLSDMKFVSVLKTEVLEHQVSIVGDIAVSNSRTHSVGKFKGKNIDRKGMETIVLKKINGVWRIWRIHWS